MRGPARVPRGDRLRASDADRDRAIGLLAAASAEGRLTLEEYSERSESALAARTQGELAALTADIPAVAARGEVETAAENITAILGNESRKGPWVVPPRLTGRSVLGAKSSELRRAPRPGAPVIEVRCNVLLGSVTVRRPKFTMSLRRYTAS